MTSRRFAKALRARWPHVTCRSRQNLGKTRAGCCDLVVPGSPRLAGTVFRKMKLPVRAVLLAVALTACGSPTEQVRGLSGSGATPTSDPSASASVDPSLAPPSPTGTLVAIASVAPSSPPASTPKPQATTRPPTPTTPPATASPAPATTPTQTRVPNSSSLPTPHGLPTSDGCLTYGAQAPYISFVDCVVHGLPPAADVTLTANGAAVFLRIGATVVFPDGTWYFPWYETDHKEIVFAVTAGGVTRSITQVFK